VLRHLPRQRYCRQGLTSPSARPTRLRRRRCRPSLQIDYSQSEASARNAIGAIFSMRRFWRPADDGDQSTTRGQTRFKASTSGGMGFGSDIFFMPIGGTRVEQGVDDVQRIEGVRRRRPGARQRVRAGQRSDGPGGGSRTWEELQSRFRRSPRASGACLVLRNDSVHGRSPAVDVHHSTGRVPEAG
jgi:hypothetical protein